MKKPQLSFWEIWNMSFGFLGIQFGFALQNANTSRIFQTLNAEVEDIAILWIAAPVTGLIVQPIIGYFSDRTWNSLGRRRPFFLAGAILASISLVIMPNSSILWMAAGMLWIMDASINISMEPFRAFVGDNLPSEQRTMGFAMQSFFIGTGAVIASMLPWMLTNWFGVSNTAPEGVISDTVKWSYYLGAIVFLLAVLWTVIKSKEYPPEVLESFTEGTDMEYEKKDMSRDQKKVRGKKQMMLGVISLIIGLASGLLFYFYQLKKDLYVLSGLLALVGILFLLAGLIQKDGKGKGGFINIMNDLQDMPPTMKQLAWVQFFSWFALFSMWIYTTAAVTAHIYGTTDTTSQAYNDGADWVGICFAVYNGVAALVAFLIPVLAKATSRKVAHMICLIIGGFGLASIYFFKDPNMLLISMVAIGIAWASILSMPYAILTGSLPANKMGYYMGVFNFFIVIPQIVAASILGFFVGRVFGDEAIYAMFIGGVSFLIAGLLTLRVDDVDDVAAKA
jgi:maltose/moltooligosaccharide transporter